MTIGDTIWLFDGNHRVYTTGRHAPDYRSHWRPLPIIGETTRSWIVEPWGRAVKVPKTGEHRGWAFSQAEVDDACYLDAHRWRIIEKVKAYTLTAAQLRQIAAVVGYQEEQA